MVSPAPRFLSGAAFAVVLLALGACDPIEFGPDPVDPSDTAKTEATLLVANKREVDPGPIKLLLYPPGTDDIENVAPGKTYDAIAFDESVSLKVVPGKYKLAYEMANGDLRAMPLEGSEGLSADWPVATFVSGKAHHLLIETDEGNNIFWRHDIPVTADP